MLVFRRRPFFRAALLLAALSLPLAAWADPFWTQVWSDEFNGPAGTPPDPTRWTYDLGGGGFGNGELETYTNSTANSYQDGNGHLVIQALNGGGYTSARLKTQGLFNQAYGRVEASIQLPQGGAGIWPAFWMLGNTIGNVGWPACGEIDMMENIGWPSNEIGGHIHGPVAPGGADYNGGSGVGSNYVLPSGSFTNSFHIFAAEWTPTQIAFFVDGTNYRTLTAADLPGGGQWVFNHPFFILLNFAVGGVSGNPAGTPFPQQMLVDYVRVYKVTDNGTSPFGGSPASLPGTIQAESYDTYNDAADPSEPGEGFAYNDLDLSKGTYRTNEGVDIEACSDTGGGYDVDWTAPGEWLQYSVNATQAGTYTLTARVASQGNGGTFHVDVDGTQVTGEMTAPNTGGWQNWQDVSVGGVSLSAGNHVVLLVEDSMGAGNNGVCNFNYLNFSLPTPPTATPVPTLTPTNTPTPVIASTWRVRAGGGGVTDCQGHSWAADENFSGGASSGAAVAIAGALPCGGDQALYQGERWGSPSFSYAFNVPPGTYQVRLKFAELFDNAAGQRIMNVSINGAAVLSNFDIFSVTGGMDRAIDEVFNNLSPDPSGRIVITFSGAAGSPDPNAKVDALEVLPQPLDAPCDGSAMVLDGKLTESLWSLASAHAIASNQCSSATGCGSTDAGASAQFRAAWNPGGLWIGIQVNDPGTLYANAAAPWNGSGVELFLDVNGTQGGYNAATGDYGDPNTYQWGIPFDASAVVQYHNATPRSILAASSVSRGSGYSMEVEIPWANLGVSAPTAGALSGLDVAVDVANAAGTGRDHQIVATAASQYLFDQSPASWGSLEYQACVFPTPTPSGTVTRSPTPSPTLTGTPSRTTTPTATATPSRSASPSPTSSQTKSPTLSPTATVSLSATATQSATFTGTASPTPTSSASSSSTSSPTDSPTVTVSVTATSTPSPSQSPSFSASPSATLSSTPSASPSGTRTSSASPTATVTATVTASATLSASSTVTVTSDPSGSPTMTVSSSQTSSVTATPTLTVTTKPASPTASPSATLTLSPQATASRTPWAASPVTPAPGDRGPNGIDAVVAAPNPNPKAILVKLRGSVDRVEIRIYTAAMVLMGEVSSGPSRQGWDRIALPADFLQHGAKGLYYLRAQSFRDGVGSLDPVIGRFVTL